MCALVQKYKQTQSFGRNKSIDKICFSSKFGQSLDESSGVLMNSGCPEINCPANGGCSNNWRGSSFVIGEGIVTNFMKVDTSFQLDCTGSI